MIYQTVSHNAGRLNANVAPFPSGLFSAHMEQSVYNILSQKYLKIQKHNSEVNLVDYTL